MAATYVPVNIQQALVSFNELRVVVTAGSVGKKLNTTLGHGGNLITFGGSCLTDEPDVTPIGEDGKPVVQFMGASEEARHAIEANRPELESGLAAMELLHAQLRAVKAEADVAGSPALVLVVLQAIAAAIAIWRNLLGKGEGE